MTSLKTDGSKEWKKIKFCNFEGILRQTRWPVGVDALHSIPISKREEKLASSWRLARLVQMLRVLDVDDLNHQVVRIKYEKVIYM